MDGLCAEFPLSMPVTSGECAMALTQGSLVVASSFPPRLLQNCAIVGRTKHVFVVFPLFAFSPPLHS